MLKRVPASVVDRGGSHAAVHFKSNGALLGLRRHQGSFAPPLLFQSTGLAWPWSSPAFPR